MADLRCPMCGKPNPQELDACRYCGARLKPMEAGKGGPPAAPAAAGGRTDADWMSDLRGDMMRNRPKTSMLPPEPAAPAPSDDWLEKIDSRTEEEPAPPKKPPSTPLTERKAAARSAAPKKSEAETPAWLSKVRAQVSADRGAPVPPGQEPGGDPTWLKRLRARRSQEDLGASAPAESEPEEAIPAPGEMPEWLSKIKEKSSQESGPLDAAGKPYPPTPSGGVDQSAVPTSPWGAAAPTQQPKIPEPSTGQTAEGDNPDWLKYPSDTGGLPGASTPAGSSEWMGEIGAALEQTPPNPPTGSLQGLAQQGDTGSIYPADTGGIPKPTQPFTEPLPPAGTPGDSPAFGPAWDFPSETPAELSFPPPVGGPAQPPATGAFHEDSIPSVAPGTGEAVPDWLADAQREPAAPAPEAAEPPPAPTPDLNELLRPDAIPEWLSKPADAGPQAPEGEAVRPQPALPENLEQAELPRWLEAMRPIQSVSMPTEDEERVESVGPLAGLRGVLSAEPVVAMPRRPGLMAGNIDILPAHRKLTDVLRRMLIEPEIRAARKPLRAMLMTPVLRKVISAVLILAVCLPMVAGSLFTDSVYLPEANSKAGVLMNALPPDSIVLVAFEYDASAAPEIEAGATVLLQHLSRKGVPAVFISTQPNGTTLGNGLIEISGKMNMPIPDPAADFGYIPGGANGLRRLSGNLQDVIHDPAVQWDAGPLASVRTLTDFNMIVLLADSPQSVRDWVEQVHTAVPSIPIIAMVSAASDALVFPYTQGSHPAIQGLVTGYAGAQAYRVNFLSDAPVDEWNAVRWQAFAGGTLALFLTLLAGIIGSLTMRFVGRDRKGTG